MFFNAIPEFTPRMKYTDSESDDVIRVAVVDDHQLVARGVTEMIENFPEFKVVLVCSSAYELLSNYEQYQVKIIVSDINMPEMSGIEMAGIVKKSRPYIRILILSYLTNIYYIKLAMAEKVNGFISKSCSKEELHEALVEIAKNNKYLCRKVQNTLFSEKVNDEGKSNELTAREFEVLNLVIDGHSSKLIADKLFIDIKTVESHRRNIFKKMQVKNVAQLIVKARYLGFFLD